LTDLSREIEALCRRWAGIVETAAARYLLLGMDRDDLLQRVRIRIWRALERPGMVVEAGYVHAAAVSSAIDILREERTRRAARQVELLESDAAAGSAGPGAGEAELEAALERALARLESSRRVAVRMHLSGTHARDIARMCGWTPDRARNLLYRGLADLRRELEGAG
jgi:RNA polymerase sigma-70 factor (ECF subfamily)